MSIIKKFFDIFRPNKSIHNPNIESLPTRGFKLSEDEIECYRKLPEIQAMIENRKVPNLYT